MASGGGDGRFVFPAWANLLRPAAVIGAVGGLAYAAVVVTFGFSPSATDVGYRPPQPVPFSHALHAGELGLDCRYCHDTVERAAKAAIPPAATCMNCHRRIRVTSEKLLPLRESVATGLPVRWVRVHDLPDYVYFDHSIHVAKGVGCESCHGRVDTMEVVRQVAPLSMGWCLDCHRHPEPNLRPREAITAMGWVPEGDPEEVGRRLREAYRVDPPTDCIACHR